MNNSRAMALVSIPAAAGLAWHRYSRALRFIDEHPSSAPDLPGRRYSIPVGWGSITYRLVEGDLTRAPLVLIHGWGKTADSAWWPVVAQCDRTLIVVDLPGHGLSRLNRPFAFDLAAEAVLRSISDAGLIRPVLVAHSMGGPVALSVLRSTGPDGYSGLVALATSAYWVRPRLRALLTMAPYAMAPRSPVLIHTKRSEIRDFPEFAHHIAWAYSRRPGRRLLEETAAELRRFDALKWTDLALPPTTWVVPSSDSVLDPEHQRASARHFNANVVEVEAEHSMVLQKPQETLGILQTVG